MKTSDTINELAAALAKAQGEMKNATINKINPHFKSKYADLAAIRDAVVPALSKHGLSVVQTIGTSDGGIAVYTRLMHSSGQWIEDCCPAVVDLAKPQSMGSATTYLKRYSLAAICGISAEEDDDAEEAHRSPPASASAFQGDSLADHYIKAITSAETREACEEAISKARQAVHRMSNSDKARLTNIVETRRAFWMQSPIQEAAA